MEIKRIMEQQSNIIIAKIESQEGVNNLDDIIKVVDGYGGPGRSGVEIPAEEVPWCEIVVDKCTMPETSHYSYANVDS